MRGRLIDMPHKPGTHLNGIRTVADLMDRCRVDPDTGCWHLALCFSQGAPRVVMPHPTTGKLTHVRGRRAALLLQRGRDLPPGHQAWRRECCESADCVNPAHARSGPRDQYAAWVKRSGLHKNNPKRALAMKRLWENRPRVLNADMRREIIESTQTTYALAAKFGCSQYAVWRVRAGLDKTGKVLDGASVFAVPRAA